MSRKPLLKSTRLTYTFATVALFLVVVIFRVSASVQKPLDHDENQFIAASYVLATEGFVPYRDFPYFHAINLTIPYSVLILITDRPLFAARMFSTLCSVLTLALLFWAATRALKFTDHPTQFLVATGGATLLVTNPLFRYASGFAWNHDASVMLAVASTLAFLHAARRPRPEWMILLSGLLLGLAIGTRLSFMPLLLPFSVGCCFVSSRKSLARCASCLSWFGLGGLLSALPSLMLLVLAPQAFLFGNVGYPNLNTQYREVTGYTTAMSLWDKGIYFVREVLAEPETLLIFLLLSFVIASFGWTQVNRSRKGHEFVFLVALLPFLLVGSLLPTPSWYQYFYAPIPFVVLAIVYGVAATAEQNGRRKSAFRLFIIVVVVSCLYGLPSYRGTPSMLIPRQWLTERVHNVGIQIRNAVPHGRVLTLAPVFPMEGGLPIYKEFVTGPFAWRTATLLSPEKRERFGMVSPGELEDLLLEQPPEAILVGSESDSLEQPLVDYAHENGYRSLDVRSGLTLWVRSARAAQEVQG